MRLNFICLLTCCALLAACTPGGVGVGVGGGHHGGAVGGVGVYFPVDSGSSSYKDDSAQTLEQAAEGSAGQGDGISQGAGSGYGAAYPFHDCEQPKGLRPDRDDPYIFHTQYWNETDLYRRCIQDYIAKAKRDQQLIQERIDRAAQEYQRFMMMGN